MPSWPSGTSSPSGASWPSGTSLPATNSWPSGSVPSETPLDLVSSVTNVLWLRGDLGIVEAGGTGTGVSVWEDQGVSGRDDVAPGAAGTRPIVASNGPNGRPMLTFDGVDDYLSITWSIPAPGATPTFLWAVIKSITHASGDAIWCAQSTSRILFTQIAGSGNCRISNPTAGPTNANFTAGASRRIEALYSGSIGDRLKVGAVEQTGTNVGAANTGTGLGLASVTTGGSYANVGYCELAIWVGSPGAGELAALDAYASALYGSEVLA